MGKRQIHDGGTETGTTDLTAAIGQLSVHDHLCLIYETRAEQFAAITPFLRIGLERGEKCIYIADDNSAEEVSAELRTAGIDVATAVASGKLTILNKRDAYLKQGFFDPDWMISFLKGASDQAKAAGFAALRATGEMTWMLGGESGTERLLEYEAKLNHFLPENEVLAICQYNRKRFTPEVLKGVIATHPLVIYGGMVCRNFYYVPPDDFLGSEQPGQEIDRLLANIRNRETVENSLRESEAIGRDLFEHSPVALWEEDFSKVKPQIDALRTSGVADFRVYFAAHPEEVDRFIGLTRIIRVNRASLELFKADSQERLLQGLNATLSEESRAIFKEELITFAGGETQSQSEAVLRNLADDQLYAIVRFSLAPGYINTWGKVFLSVSDITERKRSEEALRQSEHRVTIMNRIANVFLTTPDEEVYREVLNVVLDVTKSRFGIFGFLADNGDLVIPSMTREVWSACQIPEKSIVFPSNTWGASLWGRAIREKRTFYANEPFKTPAGHIPIANFLTVPIIFAGETIGLLSVANKAGGYCEEDQGLMESIALSISPILNVRLQRDAQERERQRVEDGLRKKDQLFTESQRIGKIGNWDWDSTTDTIFWSVGYYQLLGLDSHLPAPDYLEHLKAYTPESQARLDAVVKKALEDGTPYELDLELADPVGPTRWICARGETKRDAGGRITGLRGTAQDITERKRDEAERNAHVHFLESLERVYRVIKQETDVESLLHNLLEEVFAIFECDRAWLLYPCDPEAVSFRVPVEISRPDYPGAMALNVDVPMAADLAENMREALASEEPVAYVEGTDRPINEVTANQFGVKSQIFMPLYPRVGKPWVFGMHQCSYPRFWTEDERKLFKEVSRRIAAGLSSALFLQELSRNEARLRTLVQTIPDLIWLKDAEGVYLVCNPMFERFFGAGEAEIVGKTDYDFVDREQADLFRADDRRAMAAGKPCSNEEWFTFADDGHRALLHTIKTPMLDGAGKPIGVLGIGRDITEHQKLEEQLRQAQKMEAIGTLAGGIAHDFNNILTAILGYGEMVMEGIGADEALRADMAQVLKGGERARELVRQILAFSRGLEQQAQPLLVQFVIKEALKLLRASIPARIEIREEIDVSCGLVLADPVQIHQVVMNLCTNAYQAMRETGGVLAVSLKMETIQEETAKMTADLHAGQYVCLAVSDTGCGMNRAVRERIFEPYFTTKGQSEGTGLGLSLVHGIVISLGGAISVYSEPGRGSTFKVYLPLIIGEGGDEPEIKNEMAPGGHEALLVVDDEEFITKLECRILEGLGYRVTAFANGVQALEAFRDNPQAYALLLTDMTMPQMNGDELAREVLRLRSDLPIIICTGFSELIDAERAKALGIRELLTKPLNKAELARAVRRALDGEGHQANKDIPQR